MRRTRRSMAALMLAAMLSTGAMGAALPADVMAKAGIYVNGDAYFTVEDATLSGGSDSKTLLFRMQLVNNGGSSIDFNRYGVRVVDAAGNSYAARLAEKAVSRVSSGASQTYKFIATLPAGAQADGLQAVVFAWDTKQADFMRDIGGLPVEAGAVDNAPTHNQATLNLADIDAAAYDSGAFVTFDWLKSIRMLKNQSWTLSADIAVRNEGSSSVKLPQGLQYAFADDAGHTYPATAVSQGDMILPGEQGKLTLQAPVPYDMPEAGLRLNLLEKTQTETATIASIPGADSLSLTKAGENTELAFGEGLTFHVDQSFTPDGVQMVTMVTLTNEGTMYMPAPTLIGSYQFGKYGDVPATEGAVRSDYLAPGAKTSYRFSAALPAGVKIDQARLIVSQKSADSSANGQSAAGGNGASGGSVVTRPVLAVALSSAAGSGTGASQVTGASVTSSASFGNIQVTLKRSDRLTLENEDVLVHELEVKNVSGTAATVPALYGGVTYGNSTIEGKAVRLDSSAMLSPDQTTTVYVFSKVPYSLKDKTGEVYVGEATVDSKTQAVTPQREWARLTFALSGAQPQEVKLGESFKGPGGEQVTAKSSNVYNVGSQQMLAVDLVETGVSEARGAASSSYDGYFTGSDGSVYTASVTEAPGRLCAGCKAASTLWVTLPDGVNEPASSYTLTFGRKLDEGVVADARTVKLEDEAVTGSVPTQSLTADLYPYQIKLSGLNPIYGLKTIKFTVDSQIKQTETVAGASKNRMIEFAFKDKNGNTLKTWDYALSGQGALQTGTNAMSFDYDATQYNFFDLDTSVYVYEKLESGTRLLGKLF